MSAKVDDGLAPNRPFVEREFYLIFIVDGISSFSVGENKFL